MHVVDYEEFESFGNYSLHFDILLCNRCTYAESIKYLKRYYKCPEFETTSSFLVYL